jgi:ribonucleoside-diphosphate reductase alpha chain
MTRRVLPNRRASETFELECGGLIYIFSISHFPDGQLAEVFLSSQKVGSHADTAARDVAIACSLALQHGANVETIRKALCHDACDDAAGPLGVALNIIVGQSEPIAGDTN